MWYSTPAEPTLQLNAKEFAIIDRLGSCWPTGPSPPFLVRRLSTAQPSKWRMLLKLQDFDTKDAHESQRLNIAMGAGNSRGPTKKQRPNSPQHHIFPAATGANADYPSALGLWPQYQHLKFISKFSWFSNAEPYSIRGFLRLCIGKSTSTFPSCQKPGKPSDMACDWKHTNRYGKSVTVRAINSMRNRLGWLGLSQADSQGFDLPECGCHFSTRLAKRENGHFGWP